MEENRRCKSCGQPIPGERNGNNTKYCSLRCARRAEKERRREYIAKKAARHNAIAQDVYRVYGHKCALCGWEISPELLCVRSRYQYAHGNEIHHIVPVADGGLDDWQNVILLCPNHHKMADLGLITREELREHTKPYLEPEEKRLERLRENGCSKTVAEAIFG